MSWNARSGTSALSRIPAFTCNKPAEAGFPSQKSSFLLDFDNLDFDDPIFDYQ